MKHITKGNEPLELLNWKSGNKMYRRGRPNWNSIPRQVKIVLRESTRNEQGHICCYCERYMQENDYHLEHIKPQGITEYAPFLADYDNMICSCQLDREKGIPNHCGGSKASWYDPVLLVSPLDADCEERFEYTFDGQIMHIDGDLAAETSIRKLQLGMDKLIAMRSAVIESFLDESLTAEELKDYVEGYLKDKVLNNGAFNEFYTTIKYLFQ